MPSKPSTLPECRLCGHSIAECWTFPDDKRTYEACRHCFLVQASETFIPSREVARRRYQHHAPDAGSEGHRRFLAKALDASLHYMSENEKCLDFGCGPVPVLPLMLAEKGFECDVYDPYFDRELADHQKYRHVFCLETAEHFIQPKADWHKMVQHLWPGGTLTLMTERYTDKKQFSGWYYKRDQTHVAFYHEKTIRYLAGIFSFEVLLDDGFRVTLFKKREG